jgi:large subunit ribosomal protein L25
MLSMEGMMAGESKSAADVVLPAGVKLISDPKMTVVHLSVRAAEEEVVVVAAPAEGDAAAAAPAEGDAAAAAPAADAEKKDDKKDKKK